MADPATTSPGRRLQPRTVVAVVLILLAVAFVAQNRRETRIEFLWMDFEVGVWIGLVVTFLLGMAAGALVSRRGD
jgi:uncharacterized integral membrane protein